jgi:hypothetical protein
MQIYDSSSMPVLSPLRPWPKQHLKFGSVEFNVLDTTKGYATQATLVPIATTSPATVTHAPTVFLPCFHFVEHFLYVSIDVHPYAIYVSRRDTWISHLSLCLWTTFSVLGMS